MANGCSRSLSRRGLVVFGAFLCYMICDGATYCFGILYVALVNAFPDTKASTATIGALLMSCPELLSPITCAFVGAFGVRVGALTGGMVLAFSYFASMFATSVTFLCVNIGICVSIGLSLGYVSAMLAIQHHFRKNLALMTGIAVSGSGIGLCVFPPLTDWLILHYGWRGACLILSAVCLNMAAAGIAFPNELPLYDTQDGEQKSEESVPADSKIVDVKQEAKAAMKALQKGLIGMQQQLAGSFRQLLHRRIYTFRFARLCMSNLFVSAGLAVPLVFLAHKADLQHIDPYQTALLISAIGITTSLGQCTLGWLATKLPPVCVYVAAMCLCGLSIIAITLASTFLAYLLPSIVFGYFFGSYYALKSTLVFTCVGDSLFHPSYSLYSFSQGIGDLLAVPLGGLVYDYCYSYDIAFFLAGLAISVPTVCLLLPEMVAEVRNCGGSKARPETEIN